jgi:hypothetical protein
MKFYLHIPKSLKIDCIYGSMLLQNILQNYNSLEISLCPFCLKKRLAEFNQWLKKDLQWICLSRFRNLDKGKEQKMNHIAVLELIKISTEMRI